jgi:DNA sulfur modification protein DndB
MLKMGPKSVEVGMALPAMKGQQGSRTMYFCLPKNSVIARRFSRELEVPEEKATQRPFETRRAEEIKCYMAENMQSYVLGAVTYSMDREGDFKPAYEGADVGILNIPLEANIKCVDGQHRIGAIHGIVNEIEELANENTALLIYVEGDLTNRRQMFSDMNFHQKRVNSSVNIDFNSRDLFARVTQQLAEKHPLLKGRIERTKASVSRTSQNLFTLGAVYDAMGRLCTGAGGRLRNKEKYGTEEELIRLGNEFFDWLSSRPEFEEVTTDPENTIPIRQKTILLSSTTLKMLASSVYIVKSMNKTIKLRNLSPALLAMDFTPKAKLWRKTGFVSPGKRTPNARLQEIKTTAEEVAKMLAAGTVAA